MGLAEQWNAIEQGLDPRWSDARLDLAIDDPARRDRAAALLAPAGPGRIGRDDPLRRDARRRRCRTRSAFDACCAGSTRKASPARSRSLGSADAPAQPRRPRGRRSPPTGTPRSRCCRPTGATSSASSSSRRPTTSSAARCCSRRSTRSRRAGRTGFRFRCAHTFGYGASAGMVRRCLARLDEDGIPGEVRVAARAVGHASGRHAGPRLVRRAARRSDVRRIPSPGR